MIAISTPLKPGWRGTAETLTKMRTRVWESYQDTPPPSAVGYRQSFKVRRAAEWIVRGTPGGDRPREARAIFRFVDAHLRYTRDPARTELLTDPRILLQRLDRDGYAGEDCDGHAMLTSALGCSIRLPMCLVLVSLEPGSFCHVYAAMETGPISKEWLAGDDRAPSGLLCLDTASSSAGFGRHAPARSRFVADALPQE